MIMQIEYCGIKGFLRVKHVFTSDLWMSTYAFQSMNSLYRKFFDEILLEIFRYHVNIFLANNCEKFERYFHLENDTKLESNYCLKDIDNGDIHCVIDVSFRHIRTRLNLIQF